MTRRLALLFFSCFFLHAADTPVLIGYHEPKVDASGRILPWFSDSSADAFDHVVRKVWDFWQGMSPCPNGAAYYLQHQVWKPDHSDTRGLGGDQISMALSSWNLLYQYLGDPRVKDDMVRMADYWLDHGMSGPGAMWGNLPYPYNTVLHAGVYDGDMRAGKGFLQPDKAGSFGAELVMLYKMTGNRRYLDAAVKIAGTLAARVTEGDADHSPWPYRVHAESGEVHQAKNKSGQVIDATYTTNWTGTLRLFSDLTELGRGDTRAYGRAAAMASDWLRKYPLATNKWGPFFEDIPTSDYSDTEINADTAAMYILEHPQFHDQWKSAARGILNWSFTTFANHEYEKWGVTVLNEQTVYRVPGNSHTSRHASVELLLCEKTGDCETKQDAIRRLNWATYTVDADGKNRYIRDDVWLTDGYGDYVRHYLRAMASAPELAPAKQNHLLRTTSVVQSISYGPREINYTKFDDTSTELLKIGAGRPAGLDGGAMSWDAKTRLVTVRAAKKKIRLKLEAE